MLQSALVSEKPTLNLAINKSRLKIYTVDNLPTYYLKDGQEFQLEVFNPTKDIILAKIKINDKPISQGGLVLKPAERVFLERYLDVAKKFLFETYEVEGQNDEVKKAIENNGDITVEFFREDTTPKITYTPYVYDQYLYFSDPNQYIYSNGIATGSPFVNLTNTVSDINTGTVTFDTSIGNANTTITNTVAGNTSSAFLSQAGLGNTLSSPKISKFDRPSNLLRSRSMKEVKSKTIETGRVEKGAHSDQKIKSVNYDFLPYSFHKLSVKLLPVSQKINTVEDVKVRMYCTECGTKQGKGHKFCAHCGTKQ